MATIPSPLELETPSSPSSPRTRRGLPLFAGFAISAVFTILFVRSLRLDALSTIPGRIHYPLVVLAICIFLLEFLLRTIRWQILLLPLGPAPFKPLLSITFIGFMANNLLPARAGELVRPVLAAKRLQQPLAPILVTTVMERIFDLLGLLTVFVFMTVTLPGSGASALSPRLLGRLQQTGTVFGAIGIIGMAMLFILASRERWTRGMIEKLACHLPPPVARFSLRLYHGLAAGLASFRTFHGPLLAALLSAIMWLNGALAIWIMTWSFGFDLPFSAACFQSVTLALAVVVPQAPGFIGVWQVAVSETLKAWGIPIADAQGFAMLFWLVSFLPVTLIGLAMLWREGLRFRNLWSNPAGIAESSSQPHAGQNMTIDLAGGDASERPVVGSEPAVLPIAGSLASKD